MLYTAEPWLKTVFVWFFRQNQDELVSAFQPFQSWLREQNSKPVGGPPPTFHNSLIYHWPSQLQVICNSPSLHIGVHVQGSVVQARCGQVECRVARVQGSSRGTVTAEEVTTQQLYLDPLWQQTLDVKPLVRVEQKTQQHRQRTTDNAMD